MGTNTPSTESPQLRSTIIAPPVPAPTEFPAALRQASPSSQPPPASRANANAYPSPDPVAKSQIVRPPAVPTNSSSNNPFSNHIHAAPHPAPPAPSETHLEAITRDLAPSSPALRIGRFTDCSGLGVSAVNALASHKLAFRSKSFRGRMPRFGYKYTKSSSGTFLNHIRLSPAGAESRPHQVRDGDTFQLGVDYQGGSEDIYKSVKIRIELGREWQSGANQFNTNAIRNLKALAQAVTVTPSASNAKSTGKRTMFRGSGGSCNAFRDSVPNGELSVIRRDLDWKAIAGYGTS
ncbi:hypothetical protein BT96DRAFT_1009425 [Gymnopus androsaceus JB14]|uniref:FHA domain-containing protein n=1 Tax=Gymnopus androsaceus JB14 TaxID=1447944 RepID=A0A6A4GCM4_9AGAR|nr:hypothetical protein BT96DRAFT_1009425 [Gymnopus androsaceus JB14]